jgi:hypothetical protein
MTDLVQRSSLVHVGTIRAEADVAVDVAIGGLHAGHVLHGDVFVCSRGETVVACHGLVHGCGDAVVGVLLVGCGIGDALE